MGAPVSRDFSSFQAITANSFDLTTLTGTFQSLNGSGFSDDIKVLKIYNGSGVGVDISFDGVNKHDFWPSGATIIIDFQANHANNSAYGSGTLNGRKGQIIYGRTSTTSTQLQIAGFR
jgi:hypothetical protein